MCFVPTQWFSFVCEQLALVLLFLTTALFCCPFFPAIYSGVLEVLQAQTLLCSSTVNTDFWKLLRKQLPRFCCLDFRCPVFLALFGVFHSKHKVSFVPGQLTPGFVIQDKIYNCPFSAVHVLRFLRLVGLCYSKILLNTLLWRRSTHDTFPGVLQVGTSCTFAVKTNSNKRLTLLCPQLLESPLPSSGRLNTQHRKLAQNSSGQVCFFTSSDVTTSACFVVSPQM